MGGSESTGDLYIELAEAETSPGQEVRGVIHFLLRQSIQADFLVLVLREKNLLNGKRCGVLGERCMWRYFKGDMWYACADSRCLCSKEVRCQLVVTASL